MSDRHRGARHRLATRAPVLLPHPQVWPRPWSGAGAVVLVACAWLLLGQWGLHPVAETGAATSARGIIVGLVVVLPGVRLLMGPHRTSALLVATGGGVLMASTAVFDHLSAAAAASEAACGLLLLAAGVGAALPVRARSPLREARG